MNASRRDLLGYASGAVASAGFGLGRASAAGRVVVGTWGGDTERALRESASAAMRTRHSAEVIFDTGTPSARKTKLLAEAQRPRNSLDVVYLTDADMFQMQRQGVLAKIGPENVRNYDRIIDEFRTDYSVPANFSALVLVYNKNKVSSMTSWKDFWKRDYAGKIGFTDLSYDKIIPIAAIAFGGSTTNFAPAYDALMELRRQGVRVYPSNEACGNALASEEIVAAIQWKGRAIQWADAGVPLAYTVPSEGAFPTSFDMGIARNSGNAADAANFLDIMLEPPSQLTLAKALGQSPVIKESGLTPDQEQRLGFTPEERRRFIPPNHAYAADHGAEMLDWWTQKFKA